MPRSPIGFAFALGALLVLAGQGNARTVAVRDVRAGAGVGLVVTGAHLAPDGQQAANYAARQNLHTIFYVVSDVDRAELLAGRASAARGLEQLAGVATVYLRADIAGRFADLSAARFAATEMAQIGKREPRPSAPRHFSGVWGERSLVCDRTCIRG